MFCSLYSVELSSALFAKVMLANKAFVDHAPAAIVEEARRKLEENRAKVAQLEKLAKLFA